MKEYAHVVSAVFNRPWAILPSVLAVIVDLVRFRQAGGVMTEDEVRERIGAARPRTKQPSRSGAVAVIPIHGVIMYRAGMMAQSSGAVSLESFLGDFRSAMADEEIGTILLDIDSPGGEVTGVPEAAAEIRAARESKRIVAVANPMAASAAYWLGAQASEFYVMPSGDVGSIGVYTAHDDLSKLMDELGVKRTYIHAGKFKVEGNETEPLSDEARAYIQGQIDDYADMFVNDVAKGRGVPVGDVRKDMGQGRMLLARQAKAANMVDGILTIDEAIRKSLGPVRQAAFQRLDVGALAPEGTTVEFDSTPLVRQDNDVVIDEDGVTVLAGELVEAAPDPEFYALRSRARRRR